ncbi:DUF7916 family protein [Lactovum odontotermitis]
MTKRLISAQTSEIFAMTAKELKQSIQASEGRVICSENVAPARGVIGELTNAELAKAFGADLILLNGFDVFEPVITGLEHIEQDKVRTLREYVGRPVGANLEPVDLSVNMLEDRAIISSGRQASAESLAAAKALGLDFVCLTGNPGTGVSNSQIVKAIHLAKENFGGLIIAGKMHAGGSSEAVVDIKAVQAFVEAGADIILVPAVGTVPGFEAAELTEIVKLVHGAGALVMSAIGTSQESSDADIIKQIAIQNKICGVDIQHIGDAGFSGIAPVENIMVLSNAIRGNSHTLAIIGKSVRR